MQPQHPLSWSVVVLIAIVVLAGLCVVFRPWEAFGPQSSITISGSTTLKATPDQFVFSPTYQAQAKTSVEATSQVSATGNATVAKLKELGVATNDITTNVSAYQNYMPVSPEQKERSEGFVANYSVTATVTDADIAKKVVDYLATTPVQGGSVTPSAGFSTTKKAELEQQARTAALTNAKEKADQTVKTLGVKLLGIKSVSENNPFGGPITYGVSGAADVKMVAPVVAPTFQSADQEYTFTVTVEYRIR